MDGNKIIVLRAQSGISGDMLVTGFAKLADLNQTGVNEIIKKIGLDELQGSIKLLNVTINGISGWKAEISLPKEHHHRTNTDIQALILSSNMSAIGKELAGRTFNLLAEAEAAVHKISPEKVTFHEVGALDSILDICLVSEMFALFSPCGFYCSPLPVCDGIVFCEHGPLSTPAPAVLELLKDVPVYGINSYGETVTPTAIALLKALDAQFGLWPEIQIENSYRIYGGKILPDIPNGAQFIKGTSF
jgi:uncharacterized protein (DUF111 family)